MAFMATFYSGDSVQMVDYTPGALVNVGDVVVIGNTVKIAHRPILANAIGALAEHGGVYKVLCDAAIPAGVQVYWNAGTSQVTQTATGNKAFGRSVTATVNPNDAMVAFHGGTA